MELQSKLLNKQYLETRIRELKDIRNKDFTFDIKESDRVFSRSLYVNFYRKGVNIEHYKCATLRISDHEQEDCMFDQLIVRPNDTLTKKKKAELMRLLEQTIRKGKTKFVYSTLKKLTND